MTYDGAVAPVSGGVIARPIGPKRSGGIASGPLAPRKDWDLSSGPSPGLVLQNHARLDGPRGHPVVLRVAELALGDRVPPVAQVPAVQPHFEPVPPVADAQVQRREPGDQGRVPLVEVAFAGVVDARAGEETPARRERSEERRVGKECRSRW